MLWLLTARKNANYPNKEKERGEEFTGRAASISPQNHLGVSSSRDYLDLNKKLDAKRSAW